MAESSNTTLYGDDKLKSDPEAEREHVTLHRVESVSERVDSRLALSSRPSAHQLDSSISQQVFYAFHHEHHQHSKDGGADDKEEPSHTNTSCEKEIQSSTESAEIIYVDWEPNDPRNPATYSNTRKWVITVTACAMTGLSAAVASTYPIGYGSMTADLNCTTFQATIGLSLYTLGFGLIPLVTAPFSEEFGRQPLYVVSGFIFMIMHLGVALAQNIQSVQIMRFIQGGAGSTGATMVGGTIADIWSPEQRGLPMSVFAIGAIGGLGLGPTLAGWIETNKNLQWRWIQYIHLIVGFVLFLAIITFMKETRGSVLLTKIAKKMRKDTGDPKYRARIEDERGSLKSLMLVSLTRPIYFLFAEPVVTSFSLWIGFAWGVLFVFLESISPAFTQLHQFNIGEIGSIYGCISIGSVLGFASHYFIQERLYRNQYKRRKQEARLYSACAAGILFPISMFIYAWTSFSHVTWIAMAIGIVLFVWAAFVMYLAVFSYLADCYGPFASSALAGQSLCRNLAGTAFPLFTTQMYAKLTFKWAGTLFGGIAFLMMPIPFILFFRGPRIRAKSKFASQVPTFSS
ncbi:MFS general substrate transporter [Schizopora paradoxa]|uniref:MFS general substrate transporter n=1 Tax=Schizopora paradoxa TaxID=27342 RepID=A0A0H2S8Q9_9AGAM|nr:MFS general substrate transporter [Schizopora paradoxa]